MNRRAVHNAIHNTVHNTVHNIMRKAVHKTVHESAYKTLYKTKIVLSGMFTARGKNKSRTISPLFAIIFTLVIAIFAYSPALIAAINTSTESNFKLYDTDSPYIRAVLFDIYQEKYTSAIGRLIAERNRPNNKERLQSELLLAHIYITFRMHNEAEKIMNALPKNMPSNETRNKNVLWMDIAKALYRAGDMNAAQETLYKLDKIVFSKLAREREVFQAQIFMRQKNIRKPWKYSKTRAAVQTGRHTQDIISASH